MPVLSLKTNFPFLETCHWLCVYAGVLRFICTIPLDQYLLINKTDYRVDAIHLYKQLRYFLNIRTSHSHFILREKPMRKKFFLISAIVLFFSFSIRAQTINENTGWFAWFNNYKFSKHFGFYADVQIRSADNWDYVRNVLIRPGLTYHFNSKNNVTVGYAYVGSYNKLPEPSKNSLTENRIWEQYINNAKFGNVSLQNRFRLEQRFIEQQTQNVFAQRLRYFVRTIIPLTKQQQAFNKGPFAAVQNEIFFNIQNKDKLNNSIFDQNRVYCAIGYRFSKKVDLEAGYMNQYINGATTNTSNNIFQMALYTRF